jgi:hypothetical protein
MPRFITTSIPGDQCIGDSLAIINDNYEALDTVVYALSTNTIGVSSTATITPTLLNSTTSFPWTKTLIANVNDNSITTNKLALSAVTTATINNGAVTPSKLSTGGPTWNESGHLNAQGGQNPLIQAVPNAANGIGTFNAYATNALNAIVGQIQIYCSNVSAVVSSVFNLPLVFATNNAERMRITADGNLGIGTSSPGSKLQITQDQAAYSYFDYYNVTNGGGIVWRQIVRNLANTGTASVDFAKLISSGFAINNNDTGAANFTSFGIGGSERMRIDSSGNVGIGTSTPTSRLEVNGVTTSTHFAVPNFGVFGSNLVYDPFQTRWEYVVNGFGYALGQSQNKFTLWSAPENTSGANALASSVTERVTITSEGNVGIGTSAPTFRLQLATDSAAKPSTNTWTIASDERIKENIRPYTKGLEAIAEINPVVYDYNGKAGFEKIKDNIGVIAQDVKDVVPEGVSTYKAKLNETDTEDTELYNFNSHSLTYILLNSVKELKSIIDTQNVYIESLTQRISALEVSNQCTRICNK